MHLFFDALFRHPMGRRSRLGTLLRLVRWRVRGWMRRQPREVPFVNDSRLLVGAPHDGPAASATVYLGLHEFEDMAFLLHFLRPGDMFADVGAGVGAYTVLAARAVGTLTYAIEPHPEQYARLHENLALNRVERRVAVCQATVGDQPEAAQPAAGEHDVPTATLDEVLDGDVPVALRVNAPGREESVLGGALRTLSSGWLQALLIKLPPSQGREPAAAGRLTAQQLHYLIGTYGFVRCRYDPFLRQLREGADCPRVGHALYLRDPTWATIRLQAAPAFHTLGRRI